MVTQTWCFQSLLSPRFVNQVRLRMAKLGALGIPRDPFHIAAKLGIVVVPWSFPERIAAMLVSDVSPPVIYLRKGAPASTRKFALMHEIMHYWFHPRGCYLEARGNGQAVYEIQANVGAAEALMPAYEVERLGYKHRFNPYMLADVFQVSRVAMIMRLYELGFNWFRPPERFEERVISLPQFREPPRRSN